METVLDSGSTEDATDDCSVVLDVESVAWLVDGPTLLEGSADELIISLDKIEDPTLLEGTALVKTGSDVDMALDETDSSIVVGTPLEEAED